MIDRTSQILRTRNLAEWSLAYSEILGAEATYGPRAQHRDSREVICKIVVEHDDPRATDMLWRETGALIMNSCVGATVPLAPVQSHRVTYLFQFQLPKAEAPVTLVMDDGDHPFTNPAQDVFKPEAIARPAAPPAPTDIEPGAAVPLVSLAWMRSGDKGDLFNVAVIARRPEYLPYIRAAMTPETVAAWYGHYLADPKAPRVDRYDAPSINALNFVLHESMARGLHGSPRLDSCAKTMGQQLAEFPIPVSRALAAAAEERLRTIDPLRAYDAAVA